jgi:hypothetical protein
MTDEPVKLESSAVPVLIYVPGLGRSAKNTADVVAEVLAKSLDRQDPSRTFGTRTPQGVSAPHGLAVAKTIVDGSDRPVLQLFEFDYRGTLERSPNGAEPSVVPGMIRSATFAIWGALTWWRALSEPAKSAPTKAQLALGFAAASALIFAALGTVYTLLVALGVQLPWLDKIFDEGLDPGWTFGLASLGLTVTWATLRKKVLALAATAERLIRFAKNVDKVASTVTVRLDEAVDGLNQNKWAGPVHVLGYSFGSLVLFEFLFPRRSSLLERGAAASVASLVTIGCPLDLIRLYQPDYIADREKRNDEIVWTNVFNLADIFGSTLNNGDDASPDAKPLTLDGVRPTSIRYTTEKISAFQIFVTGKTHSSYWGAADEANCFDGLVSSLLRPKGAELS